MADFSRGPNTFVLKVRGDSMRDDHILDGDFIVVEQSQVANNGEIVVALVGDDEATVKRIYAELSDGGSIQMPLAQKPEPRRIEAVERPDGSDLFGFHGTSEI